MAYTKTVWENAPSTNTPINATRLNNIENGIETLDTTKAPLTAPTFATSITGSYLTASEMLITDANKKIVSASVATYPSLTELSYVKGLTSSAQTQLTNLKDRGYGIYNSFISTPFTTTSGSYVNITDGGTDNLNFSITTKGGRVVIEVAAPISVNTQVGFLGVRINNTDYDIVFSNATTSMFSVGKVVVTGLAAGTYTVQLRGKVQTATTVTLTVGSYKTISIFALEI